MTTAETCIAQCQQWVDTFIRSHSVCPFADKVVQDNRLDYRCLTDASVETVITEIFIILQAMQRDKTPETVLVILPAWQDDFDDFLHLSELARAVLQEYELSATFQFANFHPNYLFANEDPGSASHFTNRSPWPMLHILRQESISEALLHYPEPEKIPERNIALMEQIGTATLAENLANLKKS